MTSKATPTHAGEVSARFCVVRRRAARHIVGIVAFKTTEATDDLFNAICIANIKDASRW